MFVGAKYEQQIRGREPESSLGYSFIRVMERVLDSTETRGKQDYEKEGDHHYSGGLSVTTYRYTLHCLVQTRRDAVNWESAAIGEEELASEIMFGIYNLYDWDRTKSSKN
tara:strand:- start:2567 stop:2896 length:330 start_codon:yes stop_codon:yes gene_type:complete